MEWTPPTYRQSYKASWILATVTDHQSEDVMKLTPVGVDIAKNIFQVHWVDPDSGEIVSKRIKRARFLEHFANWEPCLIGMEACGGAHHWARQLAKMGHQVKLMAARFVKAFNIGNKSDPADASAIWLAVQQPGKAVSVKTEGQQAVLSLHRMRQQLIKFRTMQANCLRGLLAEYGEVMGKGRCALDKAMPIVQAIVAERLPAVLIDTLREQWNGLSKLDEQIATIERRLRAWMKEDKASKSIAAIPGVGLLTATAAVATMGGPQVVQIGPRIRGLARLGTPTNGLRRQGDPAGHQQEGRYLSADPPDSRCARRAL
jgi:transposase